MKSHKNNGFTIVELLIVIVVIGILAAIVIVAYNGIQTRSRVTAATAIVTAIEKKAMAYQSIYGQLPTADQLYYNQAPGNTTTNSGATEARLDGLTIAAKNTGAASQLGPATTADNGTKSARYVYQDGTCGWIDYWDYNNNRITTLSTSPSSERVGC